MSGFVCPHCGKGTDLFGKGGGYRTALAANIPLLARIPFDPKMVECGDTGKPYVENYPDSEVSKAYDQIVTKMMKEGQIKAAVG